MSETPEVNLPEFLLESYEVYLEAWNYPKGSYVKKGDILASAKTKEQSISLLAPKAGQFFSIVAEQGTYKEYTPLAVIADDAFYEKFLSDALLLEMEKK